MSSGPGPGPGPRAWAPGPGPWALGPFWALGMLGAGSDEIYPYNLPRESYVDGAPMRECHTHTWGNPGRGSIHLFVNLDPHTLEPKRPY